MKPFASAMISTAIASPATNSGGDRANFFGG
ncbi:hypothetical protein DFA_00611 [Cavenderia fasciculata]|uniref:Uncharacterized protein n=1 Tax=Cavenderia fasciculata TaxID=261658 RepID=F4PSV9_CACFS|nr:uncharacterized protein DFA_00611 [Cavenderia fasciculata]EGG20748.1 hypothetical protein DFA_00611 [Cavenderia fasciculata]|eukprot:XP_004358598.1 hypothetical protein DFA_00611 [Cavenderia fasciculata]